MPFRQQAIIWTNADPVPRSIYAALGGDELIIMFLKIIELIKGWNKYPSLIWCIGFQANLKLITFFINLTFDKCTFVHIYSIQHSLVYYLLNYVCFLYMHVLCFIEFRNLITSPQCILIFVYFNFWHVFLSWFCVSCIQYFLLICISNFQDWEVFTLFFIHWLLIDP